MLDFTKKKSPSLYEPSNFQGPITWIDLEAQFRSYAGNRDSSLLWLLYTRFRFRVLTLAFGSRNGTFSNVSLTSVNKSISTLSL